MHHVIIGCGAAGRAALNRIRRDEPNAKITIISDELDPFYLRPYLGYFLINERLPEAQQLADAELSETTGVDFIMGVRVNRVMPKENAVELANGKKLNYNFLLVATGTRFWPQELAPEGTQYYTLKTKADALRLKREAETVESVLVYGGGYQALELTRIFHLKGKKVRWLAPPGFFWPRQLPGVTALDVKNKLDALNLDVRINRRVVQTLDLDGKRYRSFDDAGDSFDSDLIVLAPHEAPRIDFLLGSGIHIDRGVLVNEELKTNFPNVFAAGDCAQVFDLNSGQSVINFGWKSASKQGIVAGENMAGNNSVVIPSQDEFVLDLMGKRLLERW
ncbi:MAG: FAD/NAD(P)-binding oxidoreductase [bacterium]|nr:FAD/NAD(P)-binding oxidoreductase [bacterium]